MSGSTMILREIGNFKRSVTLEAPLKKPKKSPSIIPVSPDRSHNQLSFEKQIYEGTVKTAKDVGERTFAEILQSACQLREQITKTQKGSNEHKFGILRVDPSDKVSTPLTGEYHGMLAPLMLIPEKDPTVEWEMYDPSYKSGFRIGTTSAGETLKLTKYLVFPAGTSTLAHTYPENVKPSLDECAKIYQHLLQLKDGEAILQTLGKLHWWLAQTCPCFRGSATIAEVVVSAIHFSLFGDMITWNDGVKPDQIALVSSEEAFVSKYASLMEE